MAKIITSNVVLTINKLVSDKSTETTVVNEEIVEELISSLQETVGNQFVIEAELVEEE